MPEMSEERLKLLVYKYLADSLTDEDSDELDDFGAEHPQVWLLIARLQDEDKLTSDLAGIQDMGLQSASDEAWNLANPKKIPFHKKHFWRAAAIIIPVLALTAAAVAFFIRSQQQIAAIPTTTDTSNVVHTGSTGILTRGYRAILTLADGKRTNLQSPSLTPVNLPDTERNMIVSTPKASQFAVVLPDGTKAWLNDASTLSWSFNDSSREATLTGEACFDVAKDAHHPFHVRVNDLTINVLGTSFTVRAYQHEARTTTTLLKGKIAIQNNQKKQLLAPNEQVSITENNTWELRKGVNPKSVLAWREGIFYFTHADIPTIMHELSGWYNIDVEIKVPTTKYYYDGEFSRDVHLSVILDFLTNENVHFVRQGNKVIVTP